MSPLVRILSSFVFCIIITVINTNTDIRRIDILTFFLKNFGIFILVIYLRIACNEKGWRYFYEYNIQDEHYEKVPNDEYVLPLLEEVSYMANALDMDDLQEIQAKK